MSANVLSNGDIYKIWSQKFKICSNCTIYKLHMVIYKFLFYKSAYFQQVTKCKYKPKYLDINGFL